MRLIPTLVLTRMLLRFFTRRVLRSGVLRSRPVRLLAGAAVASLLVTCAAAAVAFLAPVADDPRTWHLLFRVSTVSALLWVQIGFLLVKTLFLNADGLLRLSYQLPLTNRERAAAFMIYEAFMCAAVAGAGFFAVCVAAVGLVGPSAVPRILEAVALPVVLAYLALTAMYLLLARLCAAMRLERIANVVLVLVLFGVLLAYTTQLPALTRRATTSYVTLTSHSAAADSTPAGEGFTAVTALPWFSFHYGWGVMVALAVACAMALVALDLWLTPNQPTPSSRFVNLRLGAGRHRVDPYSAFVLRSTQTWLAACVAWALFAYLALATRINPLWALCVASMSGLYQFAATAVLRTLPGRRPGAWQIYAALLRSQCLLLAAFLIPGAVAAWLAGSADLVGIGQAALGCLAGAVITVGIGIVFPAENDNPFSVFIGLALTFALLALVGVALGMLHLPRPSVLAALVCATALFAWYSVEGIRVTESRRRHEEGSVGREQRRRGGDHHPGTGRWNDLAPHVHDS